MAFSVSAYILTIVIVHVSIIQLSTIDEQGPFEIAPSDGTQDYAVDGVYLTLR